ncbi:MAG TPA: response regulator transcription factor [Candidatus Competibacteraceae bacterium]|nr:response regulator transcription factor [Candidatus Competibacteraceae bacterium]
MAMEPTVFIVDDEAPVRESLELLLHSAGLRVQSYPSALAFLAAYRPERPGCLLLDVRMPGMSGLELQEELQRRGHSIPVVFLSGHGDVPMAVHAMKRGAQDFLQKPCDDSLLLERVRQALARDLNERRRQRRIATALARLQLLSPREFQVLELIVAGCLNKVIAARLSLSLATVESHRRSIMTKLRASSLSDLVRLLECYRQHATQGASGEPERSYADPT